MATIGELVLRVQNLYSKGATSDDSRLSNRLIYSKMKSARAFILDQYKRQMNVKNLYEYLDCVSLIEVSKYECECLDLYACEQLWRSEYELPKLFQFSYGHELNVFNIKIGTKKYTEIPYNRIRYSHAGKYPTAVSYFFVKNNYLYFLDEDMPEVVTVQGVFEDEEEVLKFNGICNQSSQNQCESILEQEFKIETKFIEPMLELVIKELVLLFSQMPEDKTNETTETKAIPQTK